ncbi:uncharacterized protein DDB_G0290685-like [Musca domestica]|uniref:Uncharacterized protein DDB_G0290685-like n=1 Tax=Musca domestica TaxID=7370 RepID=A0ABM3V3D8_MUSDO|nr:uncharacterized protein DDB_G0290685-like [Musca domestica]
MNAKRTDDYYRMHCTIQMDLPEKFGSFAQRVQHQLTSYRKMADLGMEADDQFYFRRVRDLQNHDFVDVTESGHDAQAHNNGGGAGAGAYDGHDSNNNNNGYYDQGHGYDANNQDNGHGYYDQENAGHGHEDGHTNAYDSTNAYDNDNNNNHGYDDNNNNNGYDVYGNNNAYDPYGHGSTEDNNNNNGYDNNNAYDPNDPYGQGHTEDTNNHNAYDTNSAYDPNDPYAQGHTEDNNNHNAYDPYGHGNTESNTYDNNNNNNGYEDNNNNAYDPYAHDPYAHGNTHEEPEEEDEEETEQEHEAPRPNIMVYDCDQNPDGDFQCANGDVIPCYKRCNNYVDCLDESDEEPDMCKVVLEREEEEIEESTNEDEDNWGSWPNVNKETSTDDSWGTPESHPDAGHHDTHAVEEEEEEKEEEEEHSPTYETIDYDRPIDAERRVEEPVNAGGNVYGGEEDHHHGGAGGLDNNIFESSGDYSPVTETSAVFTPPTGCRGDSTYTCRESNVQICDEHLCDGVEHCPDGEDELNCGSDDEFNYEKVCSANEFMCDQRCLPMEYRCNGYNECNDGSDERDCPEKGKFDFICFHFFILSIIDDILQCVIDKISDAKYCYKLWFVEDNFCIVIE